MCNYVPSYGSAHLLDPNTPGWYWEGKLAASELSGCRGSYTEDEGGFEFSQKEVESWVLCLFCLQAWRKLFCVVFQPHPWQSVAFHMVEKPRYFTS